jgi:hypothetical protein
MTTNGTETINDGLVIASFLHTRQHPADREKRTVLVAMPEWALSRKPSSTDESPVILEYVVSSVYGTHNGEKQTSPGYSVVWDEGWAQGRYFIVQAEGITPYGTRCEAIKEFESRIASV